LIAIEVVGLFTEAGKLKTVAGSTYVAVAMLNEVAGVIPVFTKEPLFRL
jgi:hypothetical protein